MADLEGLLDRLLRESVEFVVVGGFAAVAHGASLLTFDLDVCVRLDPGNLARLYDGAVARFTFGVAARRAATFMDVSSPRRGRGRPRARARFA